MKIFIPIVLAGIFLAGCETTRVVAHVSSFSDLSAPASEKTIHLVAYPDERNNSLEWKAYKAKFAERFLAAGYNIGDFDDADYVAFISYGIGDGNTNKVTYNSPVYGQTGGGTSHHSGSVSTHGVYPNTGTYYGTYSGTSTQMPTFGVVGTATNTVAITRYTRNIAIDMVEKDSLKLAKPKKVYESRIKSTGSCAQLTEVIDEMIEALFQKFPSGSGRVVVPGIFDC